jgi:general stress protein YciG
MAGRTGYEPLVKGDAIMSQQSKRGFAAMSPDLQRRIASKGGKAAHARGTAHVFTPEEAREAGRKGGKAAHGQRPEPPVVQVLPPVRPTEVPVESQGSAQTPFTRVERGPYLL